jgi:hypothetical protein
MLNRFSVRSRCGLEWNLASAGQIVARFQAHDALRTLLLSGVNFHQIFAQSPFANNTLDFIALWILDEMRSSAFCSFATQTPQTYGEYASGKTTIPSGGGSPLAIRINVVQPGCSRSVLN